MLKSTENRALYYGRFTAKRLRDNHLETAKITPLPFRLERTMTVHASVMPLVPAQ